MPFEIHIIIEYFKKSKFLLNNEDDFKSCFVMTDVE